MHIDRLGHLPAPFAAWNPQATRSGKWHLSSIFFLILFYFLTLQYCIDFAIYRNESATGIHVFPILNPPPSSLPSGLSHCTSSKHPVSCIEPELAARFIYDIIHVSNYTFKNR